MQPLHKTIFIRRRRENALKKKYRPQRFMAGLGRAVILLISISLTLAVLAGGFVFTQVTRDLPSLDMLPIFLNEENGLFLEPTRIYDRSGEILLAELENPGVERRYLKLDPEEPNHFSAQLTRIMVASLQPDFWSSSGFSLAEWNNPQPVTIAERLVDTLLLEKEPASLKRSIRMRLLAGQLVAKYGRVKVLEWYINSAYAGHLAYSMDSAAQLYLGKSAQDLNLPEAVLLTSVHMAPGLNPLDTPAAAREYQEVLAENLALNGYITASELTDILTTQVPVKTIKQAAEFSAFTRIVIDQAASIVGKQTLERGGLIILSTLDAGLQAQAECILQLQLNRIMNNVDGELETSAFDCESASVLPGLPLSLLSQQVNAVGSAAVLENTTGEIRALVGDIDWARIESGLNTHQAGSLLTPIAAVAAFSRGFSPATLLWDLPASTSG
ncbi:MAG: penicillin-binding protein, partial [Anaerolineaceae bacterium]|nr:penicillin-binding protein [Anaerolineaceae bacterium]